MGRLFPHSGGLSGHCIRELISALLMIPGLSGLSCKPLPFDEVPRPLSLLLGVSLCVRTLFDIASTL